MCVGAQNWWRNTKDRGRERRAILFATNELNVITNGVTLVSTAINWQQLSEHVSDTAYTSVIFKTNQLSPQSQTYLHHLVWCVYLIFCTPVSCQQTCELYLQLIYHSLNEIHFPVIQTSCHFNRLDLLKKWNFRISTEI